MSKSYDDPGFNYLPAIAEIRADLLEADPDWTGDDELARATWCDLFGVPESAPAFVPYPEAERERLFALLNAQGTACAETVLRESNFTTAERERVERNVARDKSADPPIPRTWTDVSDNDVCREAIE